MGSGTRSEMEKHSGYGTQSKSNPCELENPNMRGAGTQQGTSERDGKCQSAGGNGDHAINESDGGRHLLLRENAELLDNALIVHDSLANSELCPPPGANNHKK